MASSFVKNITSENIVLCDLNNIVLPPNKVVNLLQYATGAEIEASTDLALTISRGYVQGGTWRPNKFIVTEYNKAPTRSDLDSLGTVILDTLSGYPSTCNNYFPINVTAPLRLSADPVLALEAATKQYVDVQDAAYYQMALQADIDFHAGNVTIGGDLFVHGDVDILGILTAPAIVTQTVNGVSDSAGNCLISINCDLDLLNHSISNLSSITTDDLLITADVIIDGDLLVTGLITANAIEINYLRGAGTDCVIYVECNLDLQHNELQFSGSTTAKIYKDSNDNLNYSATGHVMDASLTMGGVIKFTDTNTQIWEDGSSNLSFKDANAGILTLSDCSKAKLIRLVDDNSGAGFNESTNYHISDGTNWNTSKSIIKEMILETDSADWDFWILQNDNGYAADDATVKKRKIVSNANSDQHLVLDLYYEDEDASGEFHFYYVDNAGADTLDKVTILGVEGR